MSEKINLRMLNPKSAAAPAPAPASSAEVRFAPDEDIDVSQQLDQQERMERADESQLGGWIGGGIGALAGAIVLGFIAAAFNVWIKWLSIAIGFLVAFGVRRLGKGSSQQFGVIGATWAFLGCVVAYHLAWCFVLAGEEGISVLEFVQSVESWSSFMIDILGPHDLAIYIAAMAAGYKFSYSRVSDEY
jgi:hypothetical protein